MTATKQIKETSLKNRFLNTCLVALLMAWLGYLSSFLFQGILLGWGKGNVLIFLLIFSIFPFILFLVQFLCFKFLKKNFPVKEVIFWKIRWYDVILVYLIYEGNSWSTTAGLAGIGILPFYLFSLIYYWIKAIVVLIKSYSKKWSFISLFFLMYILFILGCYS